MSEIKKSNPQYHKDPEIKALVELAENKPQSNETKQKIKELGLDRQDVAEIFFDRRSPFASRFAMVLIKGNPPKNEIIGVAGFLLRPFEKSPIAKAFAKYRESHW